MKVGNNSSTRKSVLIMTLFNFAKFFTRLIFRKIIIQAENDAIKIIEDLLRPDAETLLSIISYYSVTKLFLIHIEIFHKDFY